MAARLGTKSGFPLGDAMEQAKQDQLIEKFTEEVSVFKVTQGRCFRPTIKVIREIPLTIFLNGREIVTLLCTGTNLDSLAIGFLKSEGLIDKPKDILEVNCDLEKGVAKVIVSEAPMMAEKLFLRRAITSGCGKGSIFYHVIDSLLAEKITSSLQVTPEQVLSLMSQVNLRSTLYRASRGVHNAALATPEEILLYRNDIGRHNAVDMIHGNCFINEVPLTDKILLTTGRITSEILLKTAKMKIPILISRNVATHHSINLAIDLGITLIGDVRGRNLTVYTHPERVLLNLPIDQSGP
jgi:FdhD protein